ncbi:hypothetical protein [Kistimonas asteriae]|uniref:hypothetical protein n=1 Tax=Kistimonas asteriae TaxID=517724 RepID=UPI001BA83575|nr:hypothetical protein [Kistimonas asteriae]
MAITPFNYADYKPTRSQLKKIKQSKGENCVLETEQNLPASTFHRKNPREVKVKKSTIRGANFGVHTINTVQAFKFLSTYDGPIVTLDTKERKIWLKNRKLRSHLKTLDGSLSNGTKVIKGLRKDIKGRGVASLVNDPANNFAFANTRLVTNKAKGVIHLESTQKIKKKRELFYHYDINFIFPFKRVVRLTRKEVKQNIPHLSTYLNEKKIKTPYWKEMTKKALTNTRIKWTPALANYALIREGFIKQKKITAEALKLLRPDTKVYKKLLLRYIRNIPYKNNTLLTVQLNDEVIPLPGKSHSTIWTPSDLTNLTLKIKRRKETLLPPIPKLAIKLDWVCSQIIE